MKCPSCQSKDIEIRNDSLVGLKGKKSKFKGIGCNNCNYYWRTKAGYIKKLKFKEIK